MFGVPIEVLVGASVIGGLVLLVALFLIERASSRRAARRRQATAQASPARGRTAPAIPTPRRPVDVVEPEGPIPFAEPGMRGRLFQYGGDGPGFPVDAPFAVVAVETTGLSPAKGDRIVEIAVVRVDASGRVESEYDTVLHPGRDAGPAFVHGISMSDVLDAPRFQDVADDVLALLDGAVVVAHNAAFVERFLAAELALMGVTLPLNPALCSLWLARRTVRAPNQRLDTLARVVGMPVAGTATALSDARTLAALLPRLLALHGEPPRYLTGMRAMPQLDAAVEPRTRIGEPRPSSGGWLASMVASLPRAVVDAPNADSQRYVDALTSALADGRILGGEGQLLARLAATAGIGPEQVLALHRRVLGHLRACAMENPILTTAELRQLRTVAGGLGLPDFFDELRPTSPQDLMVSRLR
ncbi:exonuclease domain-containing protein [Blastococcus haudaquaticus]|uniref:DNA polymerase-3 subunit epsilon n=1 Tax=Blastococcus haudaquaticus TaxID=1938745 RepID=A0A286GVD0_9ACTN|nr:exonuclease domain-containing protein [Blastococcus haudaquaticus]SOD99432.1 DNA polymerase-3 subunit epsilon [Blastococcus haudaquaticus]